MKICRLSVNLPEDGLVVRALAFCKAALVLQGVSIMLYQVGCEGCVHDVLEPTRGISPQKYVLKYETLVKSNVQFTSRWPDEIPSTIDSQSIGNALRFHLHRRQEDATKAKTRPKRYVEDGQNKETPNNTEPKGNKTTAQNRFTRLRQKNFTVPPSGFANATSTANVKNSSSTSVMDYANLFKPIRIKLFFDDENIEYGNSSNEYQRLNQSLQRAVEKVGQILSVIPVEGPLLFSRTPALICGSFWGGYSSDVNQKRCAIANPSYEGEKCLDEFKIPEDHLRGYPIYKNNNNPPTDMLYEDGRGLQDTDTVIYIHARKTKLCSSKDVIAYATFCQLDQHNRPVAGFANFCPDYLGDILYDEDVLYLTSLHEFFHALGFSKDLFDKFQNCSPKIIRKKEEDDDGRESHIEWACEHRKNTISFIQGRKHIVSPAVRRETRKHLNCSTKGGCPLENIVVPPLTSSHWEGRFMQGSLMAPTVGLPHLTVIDNITLATFEDMGWYKVSYDHAENLAWGKNAGCNFGAVNSCHDRSSPFFCQRGLGSIRNGCHYLHLDKGSCETDKYLENCRVYKAHAGMECWREKNETRLSEWKGEIFSRRSRCFISDLVSQTTLYQPSKSTRRVEGRCYLHRCNDTETLEVQVHGSEWKICPEGSYIEFDGYDGKLRCPSAAVLCGYEFDSAAAPAVGPTSVTHTGNSYCAKLTITFPKLAEIHYQIGRHEKRLDVARDAQQKLNLFLAKFVNEIVAVTDIDETRIVDVKFISNTAVQFLLLKDLDWTTLTPKDPLSSLNPSDYGTGNNNDGLKADPLTYSYKEVSCTEAVRRLLVSVSDGDFKVPVDGNLYKADKINFSSPDEETNTLKARMREPTEKPSRTGVLAAIAVGSVCGAMLISVGVMIYWKSQVTTAVSPAPPTPTSADVRYHPNNGSTVITSSEHGSFGQLTFVA